MLQQLRGALIDKLDEQRENEPFCLIKWSDTNQLEILLQELISLPAAETLRIHATYAIFIDGHRRHGTVLAKGSKKECELAAFKLSPEQQKYSQNKNLGQHDELLNDLVLIRILNNLIDRTRIRPGEDNDDEVHHVECATCGMKPLVRTDRYRCLECSSSSSGYDLCGRCFEKRRQSGQHRTGHAMAHFKLPNEFLGIETDRFHEQLNLQQLRNFTSLQHEQHDGITCDGECKRKNFIGLRFKCDTCPNYNLCQRCAIDKHCVSKMHTRDHPILLASNRMMPSISPDDIELGDILGRGGFGYVCKAKWISRNRQVACKVIEVSGISKTADNLQQSFLMELAAYRELSGPYIIRTFGYATRQLPSNGIRSSTNQFMILMEFMSRGSLQNVLENEPNQLSLRRKLALSRQIAAGMRRIHEHGMIHRDIRPDNVLITENYIAKIGDMGIARVLDPAGQHTQMGCLQFMPPEFFLQSSDGHVHCDAKLDIYTYGLTLNQLYTETMHDFRFASPTPQVTLKKASPIFYDEIIRPCMEKDPKRRPTASQIENTLEMYEQAFGEMMTTDQYIKMNTNEKNRVFMRYYEDNRGRIQRVLKEKLPPPTAIEIPVHVSVSNKALAPEKETADNDSCRIN